MPRNIRLLALGLLISALAIIFIVRDINLDLFAEALRTARYEFLLPTIALLLAGLVTRALRWRLLLAGSLPLRRAFSIMNVAYLVNGVLPLRIGEFARMYLAWRSPQTVPVVRTGSTIIVERLLDLLAVVVMMLLALAAGPVPPELQAAGRAASVAVVVGFAVLLILARQRRLTERIITSTSERFPPLQRLPLNTLAGQFLDGLEPIAHLRTLLPALGWTAISWILSVCAGYVLMFAFFDTASWATTALYISAAAFAIALPAVPGNIGTYEASILLALVTMGYEQSSTAIAFAVMVHAVNVFVHALTGIVGMIEEGISLDQLRQGVRELQSRPD